MSDGKPFTPPSQDTTPQPPGEGEVRAERESLRRRELAARTREEAVELCEQAAGSRETPHAVAEGSETVARERECALTAREEAARLREDALHAGEAAALARLEGAQLNAQLRDANERLVVASVKAQDAEEEAERANRLKDEFLATVSHELRTPLNAVLGWARMLASNQLTPERASHAVQSIERNAASLSHIVADLLDVSRIIAGTLQLESQPVDLIVLTQAALDVVKPLAVAKDIQLRLSADSSTRGVVSGDAVRLQQVIWNLLTNAIKFTSEGGRVDVSVERAQSQMAVKVTDTGQGINAEFLPHVFERFRQADGGMSRRHGGLGLGLAIVRQLVERHGGTVHAASPGVGGGATFTVCLPILEVDARMERASALGERRSGGLTGSPKPRAQRLDGLLIVVVDDDADGRSLTLLILTQAGANVKTVASAREALQALELERPDALVTDIGLPDKDGYALLREIRQHEAERGGWLPIIALTGYARAEDRTRVLAAGFQGHVAKPVEPAELIATIAAVAQDPLRQSN
ncbi:MAG TPA: ATP-binding protein [Vicinamibacterales bacterium]|nr:ATP-binding protein [Vicinamibacterales bacterium]